MTNVEALDIFRATGALLEGHFVLRSGLHSRQFFQCALALQSMPVVEKLGAALSDHQSAHRGGNHRAGPEWANLLGQGSAEFLHNGQ